VLPKVLVAGHWVGWLDEAGPCLDSPAISEALGIPVRAVVGTADRRRGSLGCGVQACLVRTASRVRIRVQRVFPATRLRGRFAFPIHQSWGSWATSSTRVQRDRPQRQDEHHAQNVRVTRPAAEKSEKMWCKCGAGRLQGRHESHEFDPSHHPDLDVVLDLYPKKWTAHRTIWP